MSTVPAYFEAIRKRAADQWLKLDADPDIAAPWHQLFRQVQSPRHVVSELLQNADDAGATEAEVSVKDGEFIFVHNGEDFTDEQFDSLCKFGRSNKRILHTIGFRGIGFKSTFSLGNVVSLRTPTLSVKFQRDRFTEPIWVDGPFRDDGGTEIQVEVSDSNRTKEIQSNLNEWRQSPFPMLFFRHLRRLKIENDEVRWCSKGPGPVSHSEWMELIGAEGEPYLILRSQMEAFPAEALTEIREEQGSGFESDSDLPPCTVELVLGTGGRLFVVLPTGVETLLPFSCNAPFIQDPARREIKGPASSPTNRWLLERAGALAATTMLEWLEQREMDTGDRAAAYGLFPDVDRDDGSLEGQCGAIVEMAFENSIEDRNSLLADDGEVKPVGRCVIIPDEVLDIWPPKQVVRLFDDALRTPLSRQVSQADRDKLLHWQVIEEIGKEDIINVLRTRQVPKPKTWQELLWLWSYLAPEVTGYWRQSSYRGVRIVPVHGKEVLFAASEVSRLGERRLLQSDEDWEFLSRYALVMNQNWTRFLADQRRRVADLLDDEPKATVEAAFEVLRVLVLHETSSASSLIQKAVSRFFAQREPTLGDCVRLAQISAALNANPGDGFRYISADGVLRERSDQIVYDADGSVESLVSDEWAERHFLHPAYSRRWRSYSRSDWDRWAESAGSGLNTFVPLSLSRKHFWRQNLLDDEIAARGYQGNLEQKYSSPSFAIEDWDFAPEHWERWELEAADTLEIWGRLMARLLNEPPRYWERATSANVVEIASNGYERQINRSPLLPNWIIKFQSLACLPDTRGNLAQPAELLCRTPETEALLDVEQFVDARLDTEANRPLLSLLGVRDTPTGPERLLERLRALALAEHPPISEVEKWYRRLDNLLRSASTEEVQQVQQAFTSEGIVLCQDGSWVTASEAFIAADEHDVPGVPVVLQSVRDLALWRRVGVSERPTVELAINWLCSLPSGKALAQDEARRVRALLARFPERVWQEAGHWLSLDGTWTPVGDLAYSMSMQSLVPWSHLFPVVKQQTADLQHVPAQACERPPLSEIPTLASQLEYRLADRPERLAAAEMRPWLVRFGTELARIKLDDPDKTESVRGLAARLADTKWQAVKGLETTPYLNGSPAGTPRREPALWAGSMLYVEQGPVAKLARPVPEALGRDFDRQDIRDALKLCFERDSEFVSDYLAENFDLDPPDAGGQDRAAADHHGAEGQSTGGKPVGGEPSDGSGATADADGQQGAGGPEFEPQPEDDPGPGAAASDDPKRDTPRRRHTPSGPSLIERYARMLGFSNDGAERFFHPDGNWIGRASGSPFPWERHTASGELLRSYRPVEHCLEAEPLQLGADVWGLCEKFPDRYALILVQRDGTPIEVTGRRLCDMRDGGELTLHPAAYRLVYGDAG